MKGISATIRFASLELVPSDMKDKLRSGVNGELFVSLEDLNGAQLKRITELTEADPADSDRIRTLLKAPSTSPTDFNLTREQIKADPGLYAKVKAAAEASGSRVKIVDTPTLTERKYMMTRGEMKSDFRRYMALREEAAKEGKVVVLVADDEVPVGAAK